MYTDINFKSKKELRDALAAGRDIFVHQPGGIWGAQESHVETGKVYLEGPHYPQPHKWYAKADVVNLKIVKLYK